MTFLQAANVGLWIVLGIFACSSVVLAVVAVLMRRAGISRKPLYWFAGFMALVLAPQLIGHIANAYMKIHLQLAESTATPKSEILRHDFLPDLDYSDSQKLFGARQGIISVDGRAVASGLLHDAEEPRYFVLPTGETLLVGRFADSKKAQEAINRFLAAAELQGRARKDGKGAFVVERGPGDVVYARAYGSLFTLWSAPSLSVIERLQNTIAQGESTAPPPARQEISPSEEWLDRFIASTRSTWAGIAIIGAALGLYLLLVAAYFFRGIAWALRVEPKQFAPALPLFALRERILSINELEAPFQIETGARPDQLVASWRYADARWIDHARAHGMRRLHRIVLSLDETERKVRAADFAAAFDASAGAAGAAGRWKFSTGLVLFRHEQQKVFGLQFDAAGQFKSELSYTYRFNLQEMKVPLAAAVIHSGWIWQPVAWQAPRWLRWLTG